MKRIAEGWDVYSNRIQLVSPAVGGVGGTGRGGMVPGDVSSGEVAGGTGEKLFGIPAVINLFTCSTMS